MTTNDAISLWDLSAAEPTFINPMSGDVDTTVAIVGGGYTGLSTALHLGESGVACQVLEAQTIGYGGSGRNTGYVNPGLWLPPQDIRSALGEKHGNALLDLLTGAPEYVFSLINRHDIQCEATQKGTIHAAHSSRGFKDLARRASEWKRLGAPVELLDRDRAAEKIGTSVFYGGLLDHRAGTINPMGYVRGLARAATAAGANIHTGVRVTKLHRSNGRWLLETTSGEVRADAVVLGTNAYTDDLWPGLNRGFTIIHYFNVPTEPLGERSASILPGGQGLWDTGKIMFSVRRDAFGRIIIGSMGKTLGGETGLSARWATHQIKRLFPELGDVELEKPWYGQIAMTPTHLPSIHRLAEGLYTPIGYNGRGITTGTMFGKTMAELLAGGTEDALPLPVTDPKPVTSAPVMSRFYSAMFAANQAIKSRYG